MTKSLAKFTLNLSCGFRVNCPSFQFLSKRKNYKLNYNFLSGGRISGASYHDKRFAARLNLRNSYRLSSISFFKKKKKYELRDFYPQAAGNSFGSVFTWTSQSRRRPPQYLMSDFLARSLKRYSSDSLYSLHEHAQFVRFGVTNDLNWHEDFAFTYVIRSAFSSSPFKPPYGGDSDPAARRSHLGELGWLYRTPEFLTSHSQLATNSFYGERGQFLGKLSNLSFARLYSRSRSLFSSISLIMQIPSFFAGAYFSYACIKVVNRGFFKVSRLPRYFLNSDLNSKIFKAFNPNIKKKIYYLKYLKFLKRSGAQVFDSAICTSNLNNIQLSGSLEENYFRILLGVTGGAKSWICLELKSQLDYSPVLVRGRDGYVIDVFLKSEFFKDGAVKKIFLFNLFDKSTNQFSLHAVYPIYISLPAPRFIFSDWAELFFLIRPEAVFAAGILKYQLHYAARSGLNLLKGPLDLFFRSNRLKKLANNKNIAGAFINFISSVELIFSLYPVAFSYIYKIVFLFSKSFFKDTKSFNLNYIFFNFICYIVMPRLWGRLTSANRLKESPFVSANHLMWIKTILDTSRPSINFKSIKFSNAFFTSIFLSRNIFFNKLVQKQVLKKFYKKSNSKIFHLVWRNLLYKKFINEYLAEKAFNDEALFYKNLVASNQAEFEQNLFKDARSCGQNKDLALLMSEGRPFWLMSAGRVGAFAIFEFNVWEYRIKKIVSRRFNVAIDPFDPSVDGGGVFVPFNYLQNEARSSRLAIRIFYSLFVLVFKLLLAKSSERSMLRLNWAAASRNNFNSNTVFFNNLRYLSSSVINEFRNLLADFSFTISSAGGKRKFFFKKNERGDYDYAKRAGLRGYEENFNINPSFSSKSSFKLFIKRDFYNKWNLPLKTRHFDTFFRFLGDGRSRRLQLALESLPRRYFFMGDNNPSNFVWNLSPNAAAITKMLVDACYLLDANPAINLPGNELIRYLSARSVSIMNDIRSSTITKKKKSSANSKNLSSFVSSTDWSCSDLLGRLNYYFFSARVNLRFRAFCSSLGKKVTHFIYLAALRAWLKHYNGHIFTSDESVALINELLLSFKNWSSEKRSLARSFSLIFDYLIKIFYHKKRAMGTMFRQSVLKTFGNGPYGQPVVDFISRIEGILDEDCARSLLISKVPHYIMTSGRIKNLIADFAPGVGPAGKHLFFLSNIIRSNNKDTFKVVSKSYVARAFRTAFPKYFNFMLPFYISNYIFSRKIREALELGAGSGKFSEGLKLVNPLSFDPFEKIFKIRRRRTYLVKINPDIQGRSRVFYYKKKKKRIFRRGWRAYAYIKRARPTLRNNNNSWADIADNYQMRRNQVISSAPRKNLHFKHYLRHTWCKYFGITPNTLLFRWKKIKQTKFKWRTYYNLFERRLWRYLKYVRFFPSSSLNIKNAIRSGLISVNGSVCVDPAYLVRVGDVIIMNNEAYWTIVAKRLASLTKRHSSDSMPSNAKKRFMLNRALKILRRSFARGIITAAVTAEEADTVERAGELFVQDSVYSGLNKKIPAPGGPGVNKDDIYTSDVTSYNVSPSLAPGEDNLELKRALNKFYTRLQTNLARDSYFFYQFHNAIYVIRDPYSANELFSVKSRRHLSSFYNPRVITFFLSHRFWH